MKRWAIRICVFLLLGAIVNVAVAWGHAFFLPIRISLARSERISFSSTSDPHWEVDVLSRRGGVMVISRAWDTKARWPGSSDRSPHWSISSELPTADDCTREREVCEMAYGWPMLAFFSRGGVGSEAAVPYRPIWNGLVTNSLLFAAVALLVHMSLHAIGWRRRRRIRRGLCPKCAYDLRGSVATTACPECGAAVVANGESS